MCKSIKKIIISMIFIMVFFIGTFDVIAKETIKLKECEYTEEYKKYIKLSDKEKKNTIMPQMCKINLQSSMNLGSALGNANSSSFDLRKLNKVTSVKNQETTGLCWAFATNASVESNLLVNNLGEYDLSESHIDLSNQNTYKLNYNSFNRSLGDGGNIFLSSAYIMNHRGPILEEEVPFSVTKDLLEKVPTSYDTTNITNKKPKINVNDVAIISSDDPCSKSALSTSNIKNYLVNYGAITSTMYIDSLTGYKEENNKYIAVSDSRIGPYYYYSGSKSSNHAITIVGWDDTIGKDNFKEENRPKEDGAWIVKNSYGISNSYNTDKGNLEIQSGDNGYYYISYEDTNVCKLASGFYNTNKNVEDNVYYYDELGYDLTLPNEYDIYAANIFYKKTNKVEKLSKVTFVSGQVGVEYKIYYDEKGNLKTPIEIASGVTDHIGYISVKPNKEILISNDKYGIIVKYAKKDGISQLPLMMKTNTNDLFSTAEITSKVSYISLDMNEWGDVSEINANLSIKAYTNNVNTQTTTKQSTTTKQNTTRKNENNDNEINDNAEVEIIPNENNDGKSYIAPTENNPSTGEINILVVTLSFIMLILIIIFGIFKLRKIIKK